MENDEPSRVALPLFALAGASKIAVGICLSGWPERFKRV
jgi:hypothetical protein